MGLPESLTENPSGQPQILPARHGGPTNPFIRFTRDEIEQSISARFEQQAAEYPERMAVKSGRHALTYEALNREANRLAAAIVTQRTGGDDNPIALLLENDAPMLAAMLGVVKAGKIFVPLDPSYPRARLTYILKDCQADLLVANDRNLSTANDVSQNALKVINIDALDPGVSPGNLGLSVPPDTLCWILYTSGSSGQPKGVVQSHRNVLHNIMNYTNTFHINADDRLTLFHSCSFVSAMGDIFCALLNGACIYPWDVKEQGLAHMAAWLMREEITIYSWMPTAFRHFIETLTGGEEFPKLRLLVLGSETASRRDVELYRTHFAPDCIFVNRLGATETSNFRLYFLGKETAINTSVLPVGYAVEDKEVLLLDKAGRKVGINTVGEIAVKSRYLSPGYWCRPELTRAVFLPDPVGGSARIYHTGDLGVMRPDGCLEHLGRKDFQVKVRGVRVELGEIELAFVEHSAIKEAVVVTRESQSGDTQLVAYIVPVSRPAPSVSELRRFLEEKLPAGLLPSTFVVLDALPLTPNGKVDRLALPAHQRTRPEMAGSFAAARTPVEEELARIWTEVLELEQVGIYDSFLDLGGHSLLATQIIARVLETFHVEVPLRSLLEALTVASVAAVIAAQEESRAADGDIDRVLAEVEGLTEDEARRLLADEIS